MRLPALLALAALLAAPALGAEPEVLEAHAEKAGMVWNIHVTLRHPDTGWDHYADGWEVLDAAGRRLGYRELLHPHVGEQPFTRSLTGVMIPDGTSRIFIRARCSVDGWADKTVVIGLQP
ncbi:MAG: hypothetical protein Kow0058_16810 [Roseovarius sp.]